MQSGNPTNLKESTQGIFYFTPEQEAMLLAIEKKYKVNLLWHTVWLQYKLSALVDIYAGSHPEVVLGDEKLFKKYSQLLKEYCITHDCLLPRPYISNSDQNEEKHERQVRPHPRIEVIDYSPDEHPIPVYQSKFFDLIEKAKKILKITHEKIQSTRKRICDYVVDYFDPRKDLKTFQDNLYSRNRPNEVTIVPIGPHALYGNAAIIGCKEDEKKADTRAIKDLLNLLDNVPNGRMAYSVLNKLTGKQALLSSTGQEALKLHKKVFQHVNRKILEDICNVEFNQITDNLDLSIYNNIRKMIINILSKALFGIVLTADEIEIINEMVEITNTPAYVLFPTVANFFGKVNQTQRAYQKLINKYGVNKDNLFEILLAADSLSKFLITSLENLCPIWPGCLTYSNLIDFIMENNINDDVNKLYQESIRNTAALPTPRIARYTSRETKYKNVSIPPRTTIFVDLESFQKNAAQGEEKLYHPALFGFGNRSCPAEGIIVPTIFKKFFATLIELAQEKINKANLALDNKRICQI